MASIKNIMFRVCCGNYDYFLLILRNIAKKQKQKKRLLLVTLVKC